ncbi:MAG TPA: cellulase, partial [Flavobacteriales bacterium]|nr:cellulase [Flavobacteriales bacterium]
YEELASFNKPIMLTEFGCLEVGGDRAEWYREALCNLNENYPATKSVLFFHFNNDITLTNKSLNWYFLEDSLTVESIKKCVDGWSWQ